MFMLVFTANSMDETLLCDIQLNVIEQYFHVALFFPFQVKVFLDFYTQCVTVQMLAFDKHFHMALLVSPCCKILKLGSFFSFQRAKVLQNLFTECFVSFGHSSDS